MALTRYNQNHYRPVSFSSVVDKFFNDSFFAAENTNTFKPGVDIVETDESFEVQLSIPGVEKDQIKIDLDNGVLSISGERKMEEKTEKKNYRSIETRYGMFKRSFQLPDNISEEKIEASHKNGILTIVIPKNEEKVAVKQIAIQ